MSEGNNYGADFLAGAKLAEMLYTPSQRVGVDFGDKPKQISGIERAELDAMRKELLETEESSLLQSAKTMAALKLVEEIVGEVRLSERDPKFERRLSDPANQQARNVRLAEIYADKVEDILEEEVSFIDRAELKKIYREKPAVK